MQEVHEILGGGGGGGRLFGDRRLRAAVQGYHHHHQSLKCPRCDSLNTKFCYYNNYNLSQPRHFCKNCRRYWTKGGILRNVPVGGGCRKSKRPSKRKASTSPPPRSSADAKERHKSDSRSSSESTSANAASTGTKAQQSTGCYADAVGSGKAIGAGTKISEAGSEYSSSPLFNFSEQTPATFNSISTAPLPTCSGMNANFVPLNSLQVSAGIATVDPGGGGMFTEMGGFLSLMDGDQHQDLMRFGDVETTPLGMHEQNQVNNQLLLQHLSAPRDWQKEKIDGVGDDWGAGMFDQTVHVNLIPNNRTGDEALAVPDWNGVAGGGSVGGGGGHLGMFDLTPGSDWSQSSQWNESDHHLYLPP